jgi:hypothetical protein
MATKRAPAEIYEGHGDNSKAPSIKKGEFQQVGSVVELQSKTYSPNAKTGKASGDEV